MKLKYKDFEIEGEASECAEFVRNMEGGCDSCRSCYTEERPDLDYDKPAKEPQLDYDVPTKEPDLDYDTIATGKPKVTKKKKKKQRPYKNDFWKARLPDEDQSIGEYIQEQKEKHLSAESIQLELVRMCKEHGDKIEHRLNGKIKAIVHYYFKRR